MPSSTSSLKPPKPRFAAIARRYAIAIVTGKIPANKWIRLACQRHLDDLAASKNLKFPCFFDDEAGSKVVRFIQMLPHTKAEWAARGEKLKLQRWQIFFVMAVFGWKRRQDGYRRYRTAFLFVPRKNGKSILAAAIGHYMLVGDGEYGAEVYSGATTEKQAWEVFKPARIMAQQEGYAEAFDLRIGAETISRASDGAKYEPLIGKPGDGASPSCAIIDEYHEHDTDRLVDTMVTGMASRRQPLLLIVTTAGDNMAGPCYQLFLESQAVLDGHFKAEQTFALLFGIDSADDWADLDTVKKANPNYGISVLDAYIEAKHAEAVGNPRKAGVFRIKHANEWVQSRNAYFDLLSWRDCEKPWSKIEQFRDYPLKIGLDLASTIDIAALELVFQQPDGTFMRFGRYYLPEATVELPENEHYRTWRAQGWITETEGDMIDYVTIRDDILNLRDQGFNITEVAFDPYQAHMMMAELRDEGFTTIEVRPTVVSFSPAMKHMDGLIRSGRIFHNGDPVFAWMLSNVTARLDAKDNVYPRKERDANKIDGPVAHIMCQARWMLQQNGGMQGYINHLIAEQRIKEAAP